MAEWTIVDGNNDSIIYADFVTIRKLSNVVKMWAMVGHKTVQRSAGANYLSSKVQYEFDCNEDQMREIYSSLFDGNMGSGKVVYSYSDPDKWKPVMPDTVGQSLWKKVCSGPGDAAEWTKVDERVFERSMSGEQTTINAYVDLATIVKSGYMVKMQNLFDYETVRIGLAGKYLSEQKPAEYDCKEGRMRTLSYLMFSGRMGNGAAIWLNNNPTLIWEQVKPNSMEEALWKIACVKR